MPEAFAGVLRGLLVFITGLQTEEKRAPINRVLSEVSPTTYPVLTCKAAGTKS
jgi:hypothetical protein